MKIKSLLIGMLACTALVGCTNEDELVVDNGQENIGKESYIAVNLKTAGAGSRATSDSFEDGEDNENLVSGNVLFFFFDAQGNSYNVSGQNNYISVPVTTWTAEGTADANSIEEISNPVLVINQSKNVPPQKILAILNPPTSLIASADLATLKRKIDAYNFTDPKAATKNFVMTNSTYMHSATGAEVIATELSAENIATTDQAALANPVDIYVERIAAKVRVHVKYDHLENTAFSVGAAYTMSDGTSQSVYAKIKGWEVTNIKNDTYLLKKINTAWNPATIGLTWNDAANHRSYWADTETGSNTTHPWTWEQVDNPVTGTNWDYYYENTGTNKSQLLVAVNFCDADGKEIQIAEWFGTKYSIPALKQAIANSLSSQIFIKASAEATTATSIQASDIDFEQVTDDVTTLPSGRYWSKAVLAQESEEKIFVNDKMESMDIDDVKDIIDGVQHAKIWAQGGYYYRTIEHFGAEGKTTEFGLVRNHLYDFTIDAISGLGTPVLDETKIITPEQPADEASYVAARINILSWRLVNNGNVTLQ